MPKTYKKKELQEMSLEQLIEHINDLNDEYDKELPTDGEQATLVGVIWEYYKTLDDGAGGGNSEPQSKEGMVTIFAKVTIQSRFEDEPILIKRGDRAEVPKVVADAAIEEGKATAVS